jgi:hypothetical protein
MIRGGGRRANCHLVTQAQDQKECIHTLVENQHLDKVLILRELIGDSLTALAGLPDGINLGFSPGRCLPLCRVVYRVL